MAGRALIVVDVQKDFCEGGKIPVAGGDEQARAIGEFIKEQAGDGYVRVIATRDHHIDPGDHFSEDPDFENSFPEHCIAGSEGSEFHPDFEQVVASGAVDEVFFKGAHSASKSGFEGTTAEGDVLGAWLRAQGVDTVDVVGIATDHCVKATALDGVRAGFGVRVLLDYTTGVAHDSTARALDEMRLAGVELTGTPVVHG
ncbi:isochorismatase family protein [Streptomyces sp. NPDC094032]|uniref:isochorismatase family protein n=1 Tax=Streptomyces sp. NPDC094032 TaxID=3155308 RepID=UPI003331FDB4